jgi:hypothetical protein
MPLSAGVQSIIFVQYFYFRSAQPQYLVLQSDASSVSFNSALVNKPEALHSLVKIDMMTINCHLLDMVIITRVVRTGLLVSCMVLEGGVLSPGFLVSECR